MTDSTPDDQTRAGAAVLGFRFEMALLYAFRLHQDQTRKGGEIPYVGHLLGTASIVIEAGGDEDQAIAALLHDAIEDQGVSAQEIQELFGPRVAHIVDASSDRPAGTTDRNAANWHERKQGYLAHLKEADGDVLLIALADKLYNARSIALDLRHEGDRVWARFNRPKEDQLWYYRGLVDAFKTAKNLGLLGFAGATLLRELVLVVGMLAV